MTDTPDKQPALEATDYRYDDWYEGRLIAYGYEPSRNRRRNVSSRTVETPLTDLNRANEIIAGLEARVAELRRVLRGLAGNAGALGAFMHEIIEIAGYTNWQCLVDAIGAADAALKEPRP